MIKVGDIVYRKNVIHESCDFVDIGAIGIVIYKRKNILEVEWEGTHCRNKLKKESYAWFCKKLSVEVIGSILD